MRIGRRLVERVPAGMPRRTVRLRLTLLYGTLFLVSGAALLGITYVLVRNATGSGVCVTTHDTSNGNSAVACSDASGALPPRSAAAGTIVSSTGNPVPQLTPGQMAFQAQQLKAQAEHQRAAVMRTLLEQSGIALALMSIASIVLGWIVAGRVLKPLRTITATARGLSASNLDQRLALDGPDDELKELSDTFDALLERLEGAFRSQRQFVANASHELRTPLARQRALIQVALADPDATVDTLRKTHERVLVATTQQQRCIDALLALSRGQAGIDRREHMDLARLADEVVLSRASEASRRGVNVHPALTSAPITGDVRLVERMLGNLLDNALRYNTTGGHVEIVTGRRNGRAICTITNTGPIMTPDAVAQLGQPFQRLGNQRVDHGEGLGLGLSIVKAIVEAHGATLELRPGVRGGLEAQIAFPLAETPATPPAEPMTSVDTSAELAMLS